jgi:S-adenosylmethionine uptake transporter
MSSTSVSAAAPPAVLLVGCLAIFLLTAMDAVMKGLVLAIGVYNTMLWRSMLATVAAGTVWSTGRRKLPNHPNLTLHGLRAVVIAATTLFFFWGWQLPLAEAIALSFIAPLIALYMAAVLLGERIGKSAIWGSMAGMAGVVVIMVGKAGHTGMEPGRGPRHRSDPGFGDFLCLQPYSGAQAGADRKRAGDRLLPESGAGYHIGARGSLAWSPVAAGSMGSRGLGDGANLSGLVLLTWAYARAEAQYLVRSNTQPSSGPFCSAGRSRRNRRVDDDCRRRHDHRRMSYRRDDEA